MHRKGIIRSNEVSQLHYLNLGGFDQAVLIEGKRSDLPILITLHGGPGNPVPFSVGCRGLFPQFTDRFIMVYWDQLGCGKNDRVIDDSFTIDMFVDMTVDLVNQVRKMYPGNPAYFFASSWGSMLSALALERRPDLVDGVLVNGQIVRNMFFNEQVVGALAESKLPKKTLAAIQAVDGDSATRKDLETVAMALRKYTCAYQNKRGSGMKTGGIVWGLLTSPDYTLRDFKAIVVNGYRSNFSLWRENLKMDLSEILMNVQVPYLMLQGDTDVVTPTAYVAELVEKANNVYLKYILVPNTGHIPSGEMMDEVFRQLMNFAQ